MDGIGYNLMLKQTKTIEDYLDELNSKIFRAGVDKSIRHTQETGYETAFDVEFDDKNKLWIYPNIIEVGDKNSVNFLDHIPQRIKDYCDVKGKSVYELMSDILLNKDLTTTLEYPDKSLEPNQVMELDYVRDNPNYTFPPSNLVMFHTHPYHVNTKDVNASSADLKRLNQFNKNLSNSNISVILGVTDISKIKRKFPYIILQEKGETPLSDDFDFDKAQMGLRLQREEAFLLNLFGNKISEIYDLSRNYSFMKGNYIIGKGFLPGENH